MELGRWEDLVMPGKGMPSGGGVMVAVSHGDDDCMSAAAEEEPAREAVEDKQKEMGMMVTGSEIERTVPEDD